jgi:hypothetical protein
MTYQTEQGISADEFGKGISDIFSTFLDREKQTALETLARYENEPEVLEAAEALRDLDYKKFDRALIRHHKRVSEALIERELGKNRHLAFLLLNQDFVSRHIRNLITDIEGGACCADKERTITRALIRFYYHDVRIAFDYEGEYTYHLPEIILRDHESVVAYFEALYNLHYGLPKAYVEEMAKIAAIVQTARASEHAAET